MYLISVSIASLVVPAISETITRSSCASLLISDDFTYVRFSNYSYLRPFIPLFHLFDESGKYFTTSSSMSPNPKSEALKSDMVLLFQDYRTHIHLPCIFQSCPLYLQQSTTGLWDLRDISATFESESTSPCFTSVINMITSAVSMAICACSLICESMTSPVSGLYSTRVYKCKIIIKP